MFASDSILLTGCLAYSSNMLSSAVNLCFQRAKCSLDISLNWSPAFGGCLLTFSLELSKDGKPFCSRRCRTKAKVPLDDAYFLAAISRLGCDLRWISAISPACSPKNQRYYQLTGKKILNPFRPMFHISAQWNGVQMH